MSVSKTIWSGTIKKKSHLPERTNAVIYCRVSTEEQVENLSLSIQEERSKDYCRDLGWPVLRVFRDEGRSAKTTDRDAFQEMLKFSMQRSNAVGYIVVHDLSRFSRSVADMTRTGVDLAGAGILLRSVLEVLDESPTGKLMRHIYSAFHQYENDRKAERTIIGMKKSASLVRFPFKAPPGYINISARSGRNLILDPKVAPLI